MSDVKLGSAPAPMSLILTEGADFICTLTSTAGDWPATAVIALEVGAITWTATLAGPDARFNVDKADVATAIEAGARRFRLTCTDGEADLVWGRGSVVVVRD